MRPLDIHTQVEQQPVMPLRTHFSNGSSFDVRHPELLTVTRTVLALTIMGSSRTLPERVILLDPMHLVRLEPINGQEQAAGS